MKSLSSVCTFTIWLTIASAFASAIDMDGKAIFRVFHAPWCGHCKALMPAWDEVAAKIKEDDSLMHVVMDKIDCTEQTEVCNQNQVQGFPTIMYGDIDSMELYEGGRSVEDLIHFVRDLKMPCNVVTEENCNDIQLEKMKEFASMDADDIEKSIKKHMDNVEAIETKYKTDVDVLQQEYKKLTESKTNDLQNLRETGFLSLRKAFLKHAKN